MLLPKSSICTQDRRRRWWHRWRWPECPPVGGVGYVLLGDRPTQRNARESLPLAVVPCPPTSTTSNGSSDTSTFLKITLRRDCPGERDRCMNVQGTNCEDIVNKSLKLYVVCIYFTLMIGIMTRPPTLSPVSINSEGARAVYLLKERSLGDISCRIYAGLCRAMM